MVRAILAGQKTQTRRVIKPQPIVKSGWAEWGYSIGAPKTTSPKSCIWHERVAHENMGTAPVDRYCPYGQMGDLLWVRETFLIDIVGNIRYRATETARQDGNWIWKPSIFMPRSSSRLTLEITSVRAERLQETSEADAVAEGVTAWHGTANGPVYLPEFKLLWESINAKRGHPWDSNPWVWVIEFRRKI